MSSAPIRECWNGGLTYEARNSMHAFSLQQCEDGIGLVIETSDRASHFHVEGQ